MDPAEPLVTFVAVRAYLASTGRRVAARPDGQVLECEPAVRGMASAALLRAMRSNAGVEWLALGIVLGPTDTFRVRGALAVNDVLPLGALVDHHGTMVLRQTVPLPSLTSAQLEQALASLVHAARLVLLAAGGADNGLAFLFRTGAAP